MYLTTIDYKHKNKIETTEAWEGNTSKESIDKAIKCCERENIKANQILAIVTFSKWMLGKKGILV